MDYDDANRACQERFGEIAQQLADVTHGADKSEMRREHNFQERAVGTLACGWSEPNLSLP